MKNNILDKTLVKFLLVGVFNTCVGCGLMFVLYNFFKCSYWFASAMNYIVGGAVSFFLNKYFTFRSTDWSWRQVVRFIINVVVCYIIAYAVAKPLVLYFLSGKSVSLQENIAMLIGMCLYTILNYLGQKCFTFK